MSVPSNLVPTRILQLPEDPSPSETGWMMYVNNGTTYKVQVNSVLAVSGVPATRTLTAGAGLTGGGNLSQDRTFAVALSDTAAQPAGTASSGVSNEVSRADHVHAAPNLGTSQVSGILPVTSGGTGGTDAATARSNLSAAASGANNDITSMSGISGGILRPTYVDFDTTVSETITTGRMTWNVSDGTLDLGLKGGNVTLQVGQELLQRVYNNTGAPLSDGQVVVVDGSQGQRLTVSLALADSDLNSATILGMVTEPIADKAEGFVTVYGLVHNINTQGIDDGTPLWLSPTVPGGYTATKPVAPNHLVLIGYVVKGKSTGGGSIYVHVQNGYEINELHDVLITSPVTGQTLVYDSSLKVWQNSTNPVSRVTTVASLGAATVGYRAMVTDANATTFASIVAGGGSNIVPVYADGTNWRIG